MFTSCHFEAVLPTDPSHAEQDVLTAVEFDATGRWLATGDKGGRVVLLSAHQDKAGLRYERFCAFKSHDPEFDYLKSLEIEEKINQIRFCRPLSGATFLLSTNDKTIKLWKVGEKRVRTFHEDDAQESHGSRLRLPTVAQRSTFISASPRRVFANAHAYHINSVSLNSDGETFLSSDDLRLNLWHLDRNDTAFNILDLKPNNMEDLAEVITAAAFHPIECNVLIYSSSKGTIKLFDTRHTARCEHHAKLLEESSHPAQPKSFFSEIVSSISDVRFTADGRYVLSRDFLTLKVWDPRFEARPVRTILVHEHLRPRLCDLYESDCIFDKFECASSPCGTSVLTGSYGNNFHVFDTEGQMDLSLDLALPLPHLGGPLGGSPVPQLRRPPLAAPDAIDFRKRVLHLAWHPFAHTIAVAGIDQLYLFSLR